MSICYLWTCDKTSRGCISVESFHVLRPLCAVRFSEKAQKERKARVPPCWRLVLAFRCFILPYYTRPKCFGLEIPKRSPNHHITLILKKGKGWHVAHHAGGHMFYIVSKSIARVQNCHLIVQPSMELHNMLAL